jgi:hypothetical protein
MPGLQDIFSQGIGAVRDVLVARASNDPTPNSRGNNDVTAPAGTPAFGATLGGVSPSLLLVLAAVGVAVYLLVRK